MSVQSAAVRARIFAESLMYSECNIFATGEQVMDPQTGEVTTEQVTVYSGPCWIRPAAREGGGETRIAGIEAETADYIVGVPFAVTGIKESHRVTITSSPDLEAAALTLEIQHVPRGERLTARRLVCRLVA